MNLRYLCIQPYKSDIFTFIILNLTEIRQLRDKITLRLLSDYLLNTLSEKLVINHIHASVLSRRPFVQFWRALLN